MSVNWLEFAASDYKLELVPEFDAAHIEYTAEADGPGIEVYVDVNVDADVEGVLVNGAPAFSNGFRTWRSGDLSPLVAPTTATIEVLPGEEQGEAPPVYVVAILAGP